MFRSVCFIRFAAIPISTAFSRTRSPLALLLVVTASWVRLRTQSGMGGLLRRLRIQDKRARLSIHNADPHYRANLDRLEAIRRQVQARQGEGVFLPEDEMGSSQQPSLVQAYDGQA